MAQPLINAGERFEQNLAQLDLAARFLLLQDVEDPLTFIVIDRWASSDSFARFQQLFRPDYEALDQQCNDLTDEETRIGNFMDEAV